MAQWRNCRMAGLHLETERLHPVRWAASSSHLPRLGLNRARRPYLTVHYARVDRLFDTLPNSAWHPQQPIDEPLVSAPTFYPNKSQARSTLDTQRVEADAARLRPPSQLFAPSNGTTSSCAVCCSICLACSSWSTSTMRVSSMLALSSSHASP